MTFHIDILVDREREKCPHTKKHVFYTHILEMTMIHKKRFYLAFLYFSSISEIRMSSRERERRNEFNQLRYFYFIHTFIFEDDKRTGESKRKKCLLSLFIAQHYIA